MFGLFAQQNSIAVQVTSKQGKGQGYFEAYSKLVKRATMCLEGALAKSYPLSMQDSFMNQIKWLH